MFHAVRKARLTELALALASVLTLLSSVGLHPEPPLAPSVPETAGWSLAAKLTAGPHECPICLANRPVSLNNLSAVVLAPAASVQAPFCPTISRPARTDPSPHEGRAPPSA